MARVYRSHHCGQLREAQVGLVVKLVGWVHRLRDHGGVLFVDLRDREGITQVVFNPSLGKLYEEAGTLRAESVIEVEGAVVARSQDTRNEALATGAVELCVSSLVVLNVAGLLPFPIDTFKAEQVGEELRLRYRYLDLRREALAGRIKLRAAVASCLRACLEREGCLEVELPVLFKSTPEGAREFLVPSRLSSGQFYALSQSPQQYKQLLMVAGFERYYSLARCFRDEDLRADRQPEFTQVDVELSFVDEEAVRALTERLMRCLWQEVLGEKLPEKFPILDYKTALNRYGSDKPDTRFKLCLEDLSQLFVGGPFQVFARALEAGGVVKALNVKGLSDISASELKHLEAEAASVGARGLAYIVARGESADTWRSPILKFLSKEQLERLRAALKVEKGDLILFAATSWKEACAILGKVRLAAARLLEQRGLLNRSLVPWEFVWVVDFPLLTLEAEQGRYVAAHHPFTAAVEADLPYLESEPLRVRSRAYDLVLNGVEIGGGSIRIHQKQLQERVFRQVLGLSEAAIQAHFGYLLEALGLGAPPHGGIALGLDRLCALMAGVESIREVVAFPKNQRGRDTQSNCPSPITNEQLSSLGLRQLD